MAYLGRGRRACLSICKGEDGSTFAAGERVWECRLTPEAFVQVCREEGEPEAAIS